MEQFGAIAFGAPTVVWTVALLVAVVYWMFVIAGAVGVKVLGGGDAGADAHGHDAGDAHGHDAGADTHGHDADGHGHDAPTKPVADSNAISARALRSVPLTVALSLVFLFGWISSFQATRWLAPAIPGAPWVASSLITLASLMISVVAASIAARPLAPLFRVRSGPRQAELIGRTVRITTGRVDGRFGEGELDDRGAGLRLQVRCEDAAALARGDEALILAWNERDDAFEVEAMHRVDGRARERSRTE